MNKFDEKKCEKAVRLLVESFGEDVNREGLVETPRIVNLCAKRLQLQERLAQDISECLSMATGSESVYVNIKADHACVSARVAKSDGFTDVTNLTGLFRTNSDLRKEVEMKVK